MTALLLKRKGQSSVPCHNQKAAELIVLSTTTNCLLSHVLTLKVCFCVICSASMHSTYKCISNFLSPVRPSTSATWVATTSRRGPHGVGHGDWAASGIVLQLGRVQGGERGLLRARQHCLLFLVSCPDFILCTRNSL